MTPGLVLEIDAEVCLVTVEQLVEHRRAGGWDLTTSAPLLRRPSEAADPVLREQLEQLWTRYAMPAVVVGVLITASPRGQLLGVLAVRIGDGLHLMDPDRVRLKEAGPTVDVEAPARTIEPVPRSL